jgi:hypothetical protein
MGKFWAEVVVWWQGKKTILGGGLVMAAAVAGVWFGKLDGVDGLTLLGVGLSIAGFSAKANRHQAQLLTALGGVAQAGIDARAGRPALIVQDMLPGLAALAPETLAPASLHLSANSVQELATAVQHLAGNSNGPPLPVITGSAAAGAAQ